MRILLINDYGRLIGGAEFLMFALRRELRSRGHEVRLLASTAGSLSEPSFADDHCFGHTSPLRTITRIWNPSAYLAVQRLLKVFQPDVVHVRLFLSQISPAFLPLLRNVPTVFHAAWYKAICPLGTKLLADGTICRETAGVVCIKQRCVPVLAYPAVAAQRQLLHRHFDAFNAVIANSRATRRKLRESGIPVSGVIWNGVPDLGPRRPIAQPPVVAFAGRLVREKGADILIHAFSKVLTAIPNARLLIAGQGPELANLKRLATELDVAHALTFLGHLTQEQVHRAFANAWIQVIPSIWDEPFGLVAAESMMRATPVVASNSGGLAEFIDHGQTGLLCDPGDVGAIGDSILQLLSSVRENTMMGDRARSFAMENLSFPRFADKWEQLYTSMLSETGA